MARPKTPLISRRPTLRVALRIIDDEGLESLSIRRLAQELNVNGASLYHHFKNKDEILLGAVLLALEQARTPTRPGDIDWRDWFIETSRIFRRAMLEHPALVGVIFKQHPHRIALGFYDAAVRLLIENGVAPSSVIPLIECVESFSLGSVVYSTAVATDLAGFDTSYRSLELAEHDAALHVADERLWELGARAILDAVLKADLAPHDGKGCCGTGTRA